MSTRAGAAAPRRGRSVVVGSLAALATAGALLARSGGPGPDPAAAADRVRAEAAPASRRADDRPNILVITVDDMASGDLPYLRRVNRLLGDQGATLTNAVATTPLCVPSRASLLTGQYTHNHGARVINGPADDPGGWASFDERNTLPVWLERAGYETAFVGKYLNGYGTQSDKEHVPRGWTHWRGSVDPATYSYQRAKINVDGELRAYDDYSTDVLADQGDRLLRRDLGPRRPWYLWINYVAPHDGGPRDPDDPKSLGVVTDKEVGTPSPAPRHRDLYDDRPIPPKPSLFEEDTSDKHLATTQRRWSAEGQAALQEQWQQRVEALQAVDEGVAGHLRVLRRTGQLDDTLVVFLSDNGYLVGEHNANGKLWPYQESLEVPMVVRGPGVAQGQQVSTVVTLADLPVTFAALAGAVPGRVVDGIDVSGYWEAPSAAQRAVPIELYMSRDSGIEVTYRGVRVGGRYTFVRLGSGEEELYDLAEDPYELENVAEDPAYADVAEQLRELAAQWGECAGDVCPQGEVTVRPDGTVELDP